VEQKKQPYFLRMRDGGPFALAGLWEAWDAPDGSRVETCAILTTGANSVVSPLHDRMPVIIEPGRYARWLDPTVGTPEELKPLLAPYPPEPMDAYPVSKRVNSPAFDDPGCVQPVAGDP
jgi:putative SOS response-associated peptidase YedK